MQRRDKRDSNERELKCKWEESTAKRTVAYRPAVSIRLTRSLGFPTCLFLASPLSGPHERRPMASRKEQLSSLFFVAWTTQPLHEKLLMGFRRAKFTQRNTNSQKNIFVDDRFRGHHPRALNRIQTSPSWLREIQPRNKKPRPTASVFYLGCISRNHSGIGLYSILKRSRHRVWHQNGLCWGKRPPTGIPRGNATCALRRNWKLWRRTRTGLWTGDQNLSLNAGMRTSFTSAISLPRFHDSCVPVCISFLISSIASLGVCLLSSGASLRSSFFDSISSLFLGFLFYLFFVFYWAERSEASVIEQTLRLSRDVCMFVSKDRPLSWSRRRAHCGEMMHAHAHAIICSFTMHVHDLRTQSWQECGSSYQLSARQWPEAKWLETMKEKSKCLCSVGSTATMDLAMGWTAVRSKVTWKRSQKCLCSVGFNTTMDLAMGWTAAGSRWRRAFDHSSRQPLLGLPTDVSLARFTIFSSVPASFDRLGFDCLRLEQIRVASSKFRSALIPQNFSTLWCTALTDPAGKRRLSSILQRRLSRILCVQSSSADWCSLAEELAGVLLCEVCNLTVGWTRRKRQRFFAGENKTGDAAR